MSPQAKRWIWLMTILFWMPSSLCFATPERFELTLTNTSEISKNNAIIGIDLPPEYQNKFFQIFKEGVLIPVFYSSEDHRLYAQIDLQAREQMALQLLVQSKPLTAMPLQTSTSPGTAYLFVNYYQSYIISSQKDNFISIETKEGEHLDNRVLQRGEMHVIKTNSPQLLKINAEFPVYVYMSSIKSPSDGKNFVEGDSDTTTLYGSDLFFYTDRHVWISAYEDSAITIKDQQGFSVWENQLGKNSGIMLSDFVPGAYHLSSDHPVTLQFGYLDDENFSFVYGGNTQINGFSFGDLLITALHPDTKINLVYYNPRKQQKSITLKAPGDYEMISMIESFAPLQPEYSFFSLNFSHPVLVNTFSSGTNFGGEFVPGIHGFFADRVFRYITPKILKEFSKEQKNMMELIGLHPNTKLFINHSGQQEVMLQQDTTFNFLSNDSLSWIQIDADQPFMISQLHNYTQKGLFMWIPPIADQTLQAVLGSATSEGLFENTRSSFTWNSWFDPGRFKDFLSHVTHKTYLPFTIFFASIILGLGVLLLLLLHRKKQLTEADETISMQENELLQLMHEMEQHKDLPAVEPEIQETPDPIPEIAKKTEDPPVYPTLNTSFDEWIRKLKEEKTAAPEIQTQKTIPQHPVVDIELPFLDVDHTKTDEEVSLRDHTPGKLFSYSNKEVVLDPGSANRLYHENLLQHFNRAWMVKSSAKRLHPDIATKIHQIDLNAQDLSRAQLFQERLETLEEAGKALALCKKKHIQVFITSYRLPGFIQRIQIIHVSEIMKEA